MAEVDEKAEHFRCVDIPRRRVAATPRPLRGYSVETALDSAAAATWTFSGNETRRQLKEGGDGAARGRRSQVRGMDVVKQVELLGSADGKPSEPVTIIECGQLA